MNIYIYISYVLYVALNNHLQVFSHVDYVSLYTKMIITLLYVHSLHFFSFALNTEPSSSEIIIIIIRHFGRNIGDKPKMKLDADSWHIVIF